MRLTEQRAGAQADHAAPLHSMERRIAHLLFALALAALAGTTLTATRAVVKLKDDAGDAPFSLVQQVPPPNIFSQ